MEEKYKRKSILEQGKPDQIKNKERFAQVNFHKAKLRRQKIFNEHRMKAIKDSIKQTDNSTTIRQVHMKKNDRDSWDQIIEELEELKRLSDEIEYHIEVNKDFSKAEVIIQNCAKILEEMKNLLIYDLESMNDNEDSQLSDVFFWNDGINILSPFLKFEYFNMAFIETIWCLATLAQSSSKYASSINIILPELIEKFINPTELKEDHRQYLLTIEHVWVCLIYIFFYNPDLISEFTSKVPPRYLTQLVRYKRVSLSIIVWILINIIIQNNPENIPDFIKDEMIPDLLFGVKSNNRIAAEVMSIISHISNIKASLSKALDDHGSDQIDKQKWEKITDTCINELINDDKVLKLIKDCMKMQHITVIKPLLEIIGNLINYSNWGLEEALICNENLEMDTYF